MLVVPPPAYAQGFHTKAFEWNGIYILANNDVPDEAVYRAAEIVFNSMAHDPALAVTLATNAVRFAIIPFGTLTTDLPDYDDLDPAVWGGRRGLGAVFGRPTSSAGEENILPNHPNDPYSHNESISLHEWMHAVEGMALQANYPALYAQFEAAYNNRGALWDNTYAATNFFEYFAETAQSYFNTNTEGPPGGDTIHNDINTRAELLAYDPVAHNLLQQIFGNTPWTVGSFFGDATANVFTGTAGADLMFGNGGNDQLNGNDGNDRLIGGEAGDIINAGYGNDTLEGELGNDTLNGGAGNDTYVLGADLGDTISDASGSDTITTTITRSIAALAGIDNITLLGTAAINATGNAGVNILTGNTGANTLDGGAGVDSLRGGNGNDTYELGTGSDSIIDTGGAADLVTSFATRSLAGIASIEHLTLLGDDPINGTGNALRNTITGNNLANVLNGVSNIDRLVGRGGSDTYLVDKTKDTVVETSGSAAGRADHIRFTGLAGQNLTLAANVELLTLLGSAASHGTGNALANTLVGNRAANSLSGASGNDTLNGMGGHDMLKGGAGRDAFAFTASPALSTADRIVDFRVVDDIIKLENTIFRALGASVNSTEFVRNTTGRAVDGTDFLIYETDTGELYYDRNGDRAGGSVLVATLSKNLALTATDFVLI